MSFRFPAGILPHDLDWDEVAKLSSRYALGVEEIDKQHRVLFAWYVALRKAPLARQISEGLVVYAARHFEDEERWASSHGINIAAHCGLHELLLLRLEEVMQRTDRISVISLAYDWLTSHIDIHDRELVRQTGIQL